MSEYAWRFLSICSMYYFNQPTLDNFVESLNYVLVCLILAAFISCTIMISVMLSNQSDAIDSDPKLEDHPHITTLLPITTKYSKIYAVNFYPIFLIKRLFFSTILIALYNSPIWQLVLLILLSMSVYR